VTCGLGHAARQLPHLLLPQLLLQVLRLQLCGQQLLLPLGQQRKRQLVLRPGLGQISHQRLAAGCLPIQGCLRWWRWR
jgi:hypothetical protein